MSLFAALTGLSGCRKAPDEGKHQVSEIKSVSMSCAHMDYSYGYYFTLMLEEDKWLFDAECFTQDHQVETKIPGREVSDEDVGAMLEILERNDVIAYAEAYKKPKKPVFMALDETVYISGFVFSDGSRCNVDSTVPGQKELENFFYSLAEASD